MLRQRLITAGILIPLVLFAIFILPSIGFLAILLAISILAAKEWFAMIAIRPVWFQWVAITASVALILASLPLLSEQKMFYGALIFWFTISAFIAVYAHKPLPNSLIKLVKQLIFSWLLATIVLVFFVYGALFIHGITSVGAQWVCHLLITVWLMDTGGYFAGKRWGKNALAKEISPNKTWEGLFGGLVLVLIWSAITVLLNMQQHISISYWIVLTLIAALVSVVGDLFESVFKRVNQVKDSGHLLPGHGGILDRIDSLLAAAPVFAAGVWLYSI